MLFAHHSQCPVRRGTNNRGTPWPWTYPGPTTAPLPTMPTNDGLKGSHPRLHRSAESSQPRHPSSHRGLGGEPPVVLQPSCLPSYFRWVMVVKEHASTMEILVDDGGCCSYS